MGSGGPRIRGGQVSKDVRARPVYRLPDDADLFTTEPLGQQKPLDRARIEVARRGRQTSIRPDHCACLVSDQPRFTGRRCGKNPSTLWLMNCNGPRRWDCWAWCCIRRAHMERGRKLARLAAWLPGWIALARPRAVSRP